MKDVTQEVFELVKQKRGEIEQLLKVWAEEQGLQEKGIQLSFSLSARSIPVVVYKEDVDPTMKCSEFFTFERFAEIGTTEGVRRIISTFSSQPLFVRGFDFEGTVMNMTLEKFLASATQSNLLRMQNFGKKCLVMVMALLRHHGFELEIGH